MSVPQQQAARKNSKKEIDNLKREVELWKDKFKWLQEDHELLQLDMALLETHPHTTANEPVFQADVENLSTVEPIHTQNDSSMIPQKRAAQEPANKVRVVLATEGQAKGLIDRLNDKNHTLREELTKLQNSSVESEKQCDDLEEDLALAESMLSECQSRLQNANCQVARSQQELDECELKAQQGHSADIAELQAQLGRINKLIADNDELKAEKERLASEKATQASEISQLKEAAELLQANLKQAHSVVVTNRGELKAADAKIFYLETSITALHVRAEELTQLNKTYLQEYRKLVGSLDNTMTTNITEGVKSFLSLVSPLRWGDKDRESIDG